MAACRLQAWKIVTNHLFRNNLQLNKFGNCRHFSSQSSENSQTNANIWNVYGGLCIQRPPVIGRDPTPLENEFTKLLSVMEYENSLLNDHELRHLNELKKKPNQELNVDSEGSSMQTAQDLEDIWQAEREKFQPAPRDTSGAGEYNKDRRSTKRLLDRNLVLVVKSRQFGDWRLPSCLYRGGETIRQTAERVLSELFVSHLQVQITGNAPVGFYKFKYSPRIDKNSIPNQAVGGRVFFFPAYLLKGEVQLESEPSSDVSDFAWLSAEELSDMFKQRKEYLNAIQSFLLEETFPYRQSDIYKNKQQRQPERKSKMTSVS